MSNNGKRKKKAKRSPEEILRMRNKLIAPIMATEIDIEGIAEMLNIPVYRIESLMQDPSFVERFQKEENKLEDKDLASYRLDKNRVIADFVIKEILKRIMEGALENVKFENLINMLTIISKEQRLDNPEDVTEKKSVTYVEEVRDRFAKNRKREIKQKEVRSSAKEDLKKRVLNYGQPFSSEIEQEAAPVEETVNNAE